MVRAIAIIFIIMSSVFVGSLTYLEAFSRVGVAEEELGPFQFLYVEQKGDYQQTGQSIRKISTELSKLGITGRNGYAVYWDDPDKVRREDLRSEAGIILNPEDLEKVKGFEGLFKTKIFEKTRFMVARFPFKSSLSILVGVFKAYPAIGKYAQEHGYLPTFAIEIYEFKKQIVYGIPVKTPSSP